MVNGQIAALEARLRNDPFIEHAARAQWAKMCRAIPLGGGDTGLPQLWLEMRPVARRRRAAADRPARRDADRRRAGGNPHHAERDQAGLPVPGQARTGAADGRRPARGRPADRRAVQRRSTSCWKRSSRATVIRRTTARRSMSRCAACIIAAAGDRLLIALKVKAREKKSWFGFGANATVHIWGKPVLDAARADPAPHRRFARGAIGGGLRPARRRGARRHALSAAGARRATRWST